MRGGEEEEGGRGIQSFEVLQLVYRAGDYRAILLDHITMESCVSPTPDCPANHYKFFQFIQRFIFPHLAGQVHKVRERLIYNLHRKSS